MKTQKTHHLVIPAPNATIPLSGAEKLDFWCRIEVGGEWDKVRQRRQLLLDLKMNATVRQYNLRNTGFLLANSREASKDGAVRAAKPTNRQNKASSSPKGIRFALSVPLRFTESYIFIDNPKSIYMFLGDRIKIINLKKNETFFTIGCNNFEGIDRREFRFYPTKGFVLLQNFSKAMRALRQGTNQIKR